MLLNFAASEYNFHVIIQTFLGSSLLHPLLLVRLLSLLFLIMLLPHFDSQLHICTYGMEDDDVVFRRRADYDGGEKKMCASAKKNRKFSPQNELNSYCTYIHDFTTEPIDAMTRDFFSPLPSL